MKFRIFLATATAASVLMTAAAVAGSNNTLSLVQSGNNNAANVDQGKASYSDFGKDAAALQSGNNNRIDFVIGTSTNSGNGNNDVGQFYQLGDFNLFSGVAVGTGSGGAGDAHDNRLGYFLQQGNKNQSFVNWVRNSNNLVGDVRMIGDSNTIAINQGDWLTPGTNNKVGYAWITGSKNGSAPGGAWIYNGSAGASGIYIKQLGSWNEVDRSMVYGDNNGGNVHDIRQTGSGNGQVSSVAVTYGSNGNRIAVTETGNNNNFNIQQGVTTASTQNYATLLQVGDGNNGTITQFGSYNNVNGSQTGGNANALTVSITGNHNGDGLFTDTVPASGQKTLAVANGLLSGDVKQVGSNNLTTFSITGDSNQFASLQTGNSNVISGAIGGGNSNQAVAVQNGSYNNATFTQTGGSNIVAISQ